MFLLCSCCVRLEHGAHLWCASRPLALCGGRPCQRAEALKTRDTSDDGARHVRSLGTPQRATRPAAHARLGSTVHTCKPKPSPSAVSSKQIEP